MKLKNTPLTRIISKLFVLLSFLITAQTNAFAQTMPWENPLRQLLNSLQGPTAQIIIIMAIVIAGLAFCVGEAGSFFRRCSAAVFGGAIAIGASSWAPTLFGW